MSLRVMISSPLEAELVERVRAVDAVGEVFYEPALLPPIRYPNDHGGDPNFTRDAAAQTRWDAALGRADALFGFPRESADELKKALALGRAVRFVQGTSAGFGAQIARANLDAATLQRVKFATAAGVHGGMLAEFFFYGLLALRKDARRLAEIRERRGWDHYVMGELDGSTLAILGMGQIGCAIATRARAFGMRILAINRDGASHPLADATFSSAELASAFAQADAAVVTLPATSKTVGLVDRTALEALRRDAIFANVGRGNVVDQAALVTMLHERRIAGAVLDVFAIEPLPADDPLWTMPNVVMSPHTAAISQHENARIIEIFCENLRRFARGERLRNEVDLVEFY